MQLNTSAGCDFELLKGFHFECLVFVYSVIVSLESMTVVVIICRTKALHTNSDIIVACLSLTDILLCASYTAHGVKSLAGSALTRSQKNYLISFLCGACYGGVLISITHLGFAAIDRYIQIAYPFYYIKHMTKSRLFKILLVIWLIGGVYTLTPLFLNFYQQNSETCILLHPPLAYFCILFTGYLANVMIVFISYLKIARLAFQHKKSANIRRMQIEDRTSTVIFSQNRKAAMKSVKFFIVMFGAFLSFTSPAIVVTGLNIVYRMPRNIYVLTVVTLMLSSFTNCLIYAFLRNEFLNALKDAMRNFRKYLCTKTQ